MKTQHSPAPWETEIDESDYVIRIRAGTLTVAVVGSTTEAAHADARLIAAAPELLDACNEALESGQLTALTPNTIKRLRAAIAKATQS